MVISCYEGMEGQSHQVPVGMTLIATPVSSSGFIMMNAANIEQMGAFFIDFKLCSFGTYDHPSQQNAH